MCCNRLLTGLVVELMDGYPFSGKQLYGIALVLAQLKVIFLKEPLRGLFALLGIYYVYLVVDLYQLLAIGLRAYAYYHHPGIDGLLTYKAYAGFYPIGFGAVFRHEITS